MRVRTLRWHGRFFVAASELELLGLDSATDAESLLKERSVSLVGGT